MFKKDYDVAVAPMTPVERSFYDLLLKIDAKLERLLRFDEEAENN